MTENNVEAGANSDQKFFTEGNEGNEGNEDRGKRQTRVKLLFADSFGRIVRRTAFIHKNCEVCMLHKTGTEFHSK